jgi:predicted xylose isomerase-like sugar epimerase
VTQESIPGQPDASMFPAGADNIQKGDGHEHFMLVRPNTFHHPNIRVHPTAMAAAAIGMKHLCKVEDPGYGDVTPCIWVNSFRRFEGQ